MDKRNLLYALAPFIEKGYNTQEIKILRCVFEKKANISEISRELNIDYKNTHRYIDKLWKKGLIIIEPSKSVKGKKTYVTLSEKTLQEILDELESITLRGNDYKEIENLIKESRRKLKYIQSAKR
ncbi:MAG: winged helix-turn-helix domain-containing protein [archaeon]